MEEHLFHFLFCLHAIMTKRTTARYFEESHYFPIELMEMLNQSQLHTDYLFQILTAALLLY